MLIFASNIATYLSPGILEGHTRYRRSLQLSKENIWKYHFFLFLEIFAHMNPDPDLQLPMRIRMQPTTINAEFADTCKSESKLNKTGRRARTVCSILKYYKVSILLSCTHLPGQSSTCSSITKSGISCLQSGHRLWLNNRKNKKNYQQTSVVDPDPDWIRIQDGKKDPKKFKTVSKFHFLKCWIFSFEGWMLLL